MSSKVGRKGTSTRSKKRHAAADRAAEDAAFVDAVFAKYDTSEDGLLGLDEMQELLTKLNEGDPPSETEVDLIVKAVDRRGGSRDGSIDKAELREAMLEWRNYKAHAEFIDEKFAQYDTDNSGTLDRSQMRRLLTDLNEGVEVSDTDLDLVLGFSDKGEVKDGMIDKTELVQAIAVWFSNCTVDGDKVVEAEPASPTRAEVETAPASSSCCVVL